MPQGGLSQELARGELLRQVEASWALGTRRPRSDLMRSLCISGRSLPFLAPAWLIESDLLPTELEVGTQVVSSLPRGSLHTRQPRDANGTTGAMVGRSSEFVRTGHAGFTMSIPGSAQVCREFHRLEMDMTGDEGHCFTVEGFEVLANGQLHVVF